MTPREIREHLGRVKACYLRNDMTRAIQFFLLALRSIGNTPQGMEIRSAVREAAQLLNRDESIQKYAAQPITYQPGQEKALFITVSRAYKAMLEAAALEDRSKTMDRKVQLDQALNRGMKLLEHKKVSEADESFRIAVSQYKDEHALFRLIGKALLDAGEIRRAYPYLKRGAEVTPDDTAMTDLFAECTRLREGLSR